LRNNHWIFILVLAMAGLAAVSPADAKVVDSVALIVDQDAMTQGELDEAIQGYFANQQMKTPQPDTPEYQDGKKQVIDNFIREVLLAEEADKEKMEIEDGEVDRAVDSQIQNMKKNFPTEQEFDDSLKSEGISLDDLKQDVHDKMERQIKATHVLRDKQMNLPESVIVTDTDAQNYYDQHPNDYERVKFSIILLRVSLKASAKEVKEVQIQAEGILKQVRSGADFAALAKKDSEDPGSAADGGDVGTVTRTDIGDPKLSAGVFALKAPGTGLVRAGDGIYIVKVESRGKSDFDSAAADIKAFLKKKKQEQAINSWIDGLKKNAYIVEDGKVVSSETFLSAPVDSTAVDNTSSSATTMTAADEKQLGNTDNYPSLPAGGSFTPYFGGEGFVPDTTDLSKYYSPTSTTQGFPFGLGVYGGIDYSLDTTLQVGLMAEVLRKFSESVTTTSGAGIEQWDSTAIGASLGLKVLIPVDESTNFILSASGGLYTLLDSSVTVAGPALNTNLSATNWGGEAGAAVEFVLDSQKSTALDIGIDYRLLSFNPVTSTNTALLPSPLTNSDGSNGTVDFSGIVIKAGLRFFLGKDDSKASQ
jgi:parvulin-like peptidyl-prolyl isomerase